jgi:hypothetical protein
MCRCVDGLNARFTIALRLFDDRLVYQYPGIPVIVSDAWRYVSVAYATRIIEHYARCSLPASPIVCDINNCLISRGVAVARLLRTPNCAKHTPVVEALTNANSLCGIIRMLCNPDEIFGHQSR